MKIADRKKTFIMSREWVTMISRMTNEQAGELLKAIYHFQTIGEEPEVNDMRVSIALEYMIPTFEENETAWLSKSEQNRENGSKGGRPKKANASEREQTEKEKANASDREQTDADFAKKGVYGNGNGYGYVDVSEGESALLSAGGTILTDDSQKSRNEIIALVLYMVNKLNNQHFTMSDEKREEFWQVLSQAVDDPFNMADIKIKIEKAYKRVCDHPIDLLPKFKPFDIFRERLWEEEEGE